jgi:hypothetical protein
VQKKTVRPRHRRELGRWTQTVIALILQQALNAARESPPMSEPEKTALLAKTANLGKDGEYESYKTTHHFDGTYANRQWLG